MNQIECWETEGHIHRTSRMSEVCHVRTVTALAEDTGIFQSRWSLHRVSLGLAWSHQTSRDVCTEPDKQKRSKTESPWPKHPSIWIMLNWQIITWCDSTRDLSSLTFRGAQIPGSHRCDGYEGLCKARGDPHIKGGTEMVIWKILGICQIFHGLQYWSILLFYTEYILYIYTLYIYIINIRIFIYVYLPQVQSSFALTIIYKLLRYWHCTCPSRLKLAQ